MRFISTLGDRRAKETDVLIACDDRAAAIQLALDLGALGLGARGVAAAELEALVAAEPPDLVVVDGATAAATCTALKRMQPELPVIAIVPAAARLEAIVAGVDHCATRPLDLPELAARTRVLIEQGRRLRAMTTRLHTLRLWHDWVRYLVHDLRGPLTAAMAAVSFAESYGDMGHLGDATRSLDEMAAMLRDILDSDRIKHGVLVPAKQDVDLADIAAEAAAALRHAHPIEVKRSGDTRIAADPVLFRRVFANLLANATRHARVRPILVEVTGSSHGVSARVANDGPGIAPEAQVHLFEPWHRLASGGTGIGLAFCRLVCEAHDGKVWLDSGNAGDVVFVFGLARAAKARP